MFPHHDTSSQQESSNLRGADENGQIGQLQQGIRVGRCIAEQNARSMAERGENLEGLLDKTGSLEESSSLFRNSASDAKRRMWRKNKKWTIILCVGVCTAAVVVIVVPVLLHR
ncbi:Vesicle membrane receptor protein (v-SNARE) [Metarhizium acridum]|nr:Vesicle membrane receptor protein (v-SNARE) [Metarhizium acridum]